MLVAKLKAARIRKRLATGRCEGPKFYGDRPGEPEVIERIIALRGEGLGLDTIAARLNAEGIMPRSGKKWYPMSVSRVLKRAHEV